MKAMRMDNMVRTMPIQPRMTPARAMPVPSVMLAWRYCLRAIFPQTSPPMLPKGPRHTKAMDSSSEAKARLFMLPVFVDVLMVLY